jgi:hypothetical protein
MSRIVIVILMYHRHKPIETIVLFTPWSTLFGKLDTNDERDLKMKDPA